MSASHSFDGRAVERSSKANPTHEPVLYPENSIYNGDGVSLDLEESLDSVGSDVKSQRDVIAKFKVQRNSNKRATLPKSSKKISSSGADKQRKADSGKTRRVTGNNMRTPSPSIRNASITQKGSSATEKALITEKQGTRKEKKSIQVCSRECYARKIY